MNVYFLLEGKRSEPQVYSAWLSILAPGLTRVAHHDAVQSRNYFLFSAGGYPGIVSKHLGNAVRDVNAVGKYQYLVVALDADDASVDERYEEIESALNQSGLVLRNAELILVIQNRCIETWFLGNRRVVTRNPQNTDLRDYLAFYNVSQDDPELMPCYPGFTTISQFHHAYLRAVFAEKNLVYSKRDPGHVRDAEYVAELRRRLANDPTHLRSLRTFFGILLQFDHLCPLQHLGPPEAEN